MPKIVRDFGHEILKYTARFAMIGVPKVEVSLEPRHALESTAVAYPDGFFPTYKTAMHSFNRQFFQEGIARSLPKHRIFPDILPDSVIFRTMTESFNRKYQFILRCVSFNGHLQNIIFFKPTHGGTWKVLDHPVAIQQLVSISCDDAVFTALDGSDGSMYTLYNIDADFSEHRLHWTKHWGHPLCFGKGETIRNYLVFSTSYLSPQNQLAVGEVEKRLHPYIESPSERRIRDALKKPSVFDYFTMDRYKYKIPGVGVTSVYVLEADGQHIRILDPWLKASDTRKILTPQRGQIKCVNLSVSASMLFVLSEDGCFYTRLWDFDISGGDDLIIFYTTKRKSGMTTRHLPVMNPEFDNDWWEKQPSLPQNTYSKNISIIPYGTHTENYLIMVETQNRNFGYGFYYKCVEQGVQCKSPWKFFTVEPCKSYFEYFRPHIQPDGRPWTYPVPNMFSGRLTSYRGYHFFKLASVSLQNFNPYEGPAVLYANLINGINLFLWVHNFDTTRFAKPRYSEGLTEDAWTQWGLCQLPMHFYRLLTEQAQYGDLVAQKFLSLFIENSEYGHFAKVLLIVTITELKLKFRPKHIYEHCDIEEIIFNLAG